jgi:transcriptional regulator with XRE-family HTH domain
VEKTLNELKSKKEAYSCDPVRKVSSIYSSFIPSKGDSPNKSGIIIEPDFKNLEFLVGQTNVVITPDVTYIGREKQKPEIVFSDHLRGATGLYLLQIESSIFPETAKLFSQLRRFDEWKRKELVEAYTVLGGKQREYFEKFNPLVFNIFSAEKLADSMGVTSSTISRILSNRWVEARNIEGEQKIMFSKGLMKTKDEIERYVHFSKLNGILFEEYQNKKGYSDFEIAKKMPSIARRTISKYRTEQGIPVCSLRKREYEKGKEKSFEFSFD